MAESRSSDEPYMLMHTIGDHPADTRLDEWPLHISLMPYFDPLGVSEKLLLKIISDRMSGYGNIIVRAAGEAGFGLNHETKVTRLDDEGYKLHDLHNYLLEDLAAFGIRPFNTRYTSDGEGYNPHVSHIEGQELPASPYEITSISLVQKFENTPGDNKRIVAVIPLELPYHANITGEWDQSIPVVHIEDTA